MDAGRRVRAASINPIDWKFRRGIAQKELPAVLADAEGYLREHCTAPVIVSPDAGRIKVAARMAEHLGDLGADLAFIYKRRPKGSVNQAEAKEVIGGFAVYDVASKQEAIAWTRKFIEAQTTDAARSAAAFTSRRAS